MKYDISKFEELSEQGFLRKAENDKLVLYKYTDQCTFDRHWNEYTRVARGLILEKSTGEVVAKPFPKFFNLGELEEAFLINLPQDGYKVYEKLDGSLGIIYHYDDKWNVATCGSLGSDQAIEAQTMLPNYRMDEVNPNYTLLTEIIYPSNKIIVNYGQTRELVLLGAFDRTTGEEVAPEFVKMIAENTGIRMCPSYNYTIEEMTELQKTIPKDQEGFVVRFNNNHRVKIKGKEYLKIAKILGNLSPLSLWEVMANGIVQSEYLVQLPEEFRAEVEPIVQTLKSQYMKALNEITSDILSCGLNNKTSDWRRETGIYLKNNSVKHSSAVFSYLLGSNEALNNYIMKYIKPTGNILLDI